MSVSAVSFYKTFCADFVVKNKAKVFSKRFYVLVNPFCNTTDEFMLIQTSFQTVFDNRYFCSRCGYLWAFPKFIKNYKRGLK